MTRVTMINKPEDYPGTPDNETRKNLGELFNYLFPTASNPEIDENHAGLAIAAHNPKLAQHLAHFSRFLALELDWCNRADLRDLAIQAVNTSLNCAYAFRTRVATAVAAGISEEQQAAIRSWQTSPLFNDEQRLVIEYSYAVIKANVPDDLFSRVAAQFGEKGAVEFTSVVAFWSFWAMLLNATNPEPV